MRLHPCAKADGESALDGFLAWIRDAGVAQALLSDTARHFQNDLVGRLELALGLERGAAVAYSP